jgi:hypothetical protein
LSVQQAAAAPLTTVSDLITNSQTASASNHTLTFTATGGVPVSGRIVITPVSGAATIPAALDFTDVDLLVSSAQQTLAATAGSGAGSAVGVALVSGTAGSLTLTLNDTDAIAAGAAIEVRIGTNAVFGTAGDQRMTNGALGTHLVDITTRNASNVVIDTGQAAFVVLLPVGLSVGEGATPTPTPAGGDGGSESFPCEQTADFDDNCRVNVVDLSILMANWGPSQPPNDMTDLNNDASVGIIDFSVLLYWWTG